MSDSPFYLIAHYCNSLAMAEIALASGANAIECDISYDAGTNEIFVYHPAPHKSSRKELIPKTNTSVVVDPSAKVPLKSYLSGLVALLKTYPQLCLIIFDCKDPQTMPLASLRGFVNEAFKSVMPAINFIYSIAHARDDNNFFPPNSAATKLRNNEAFAIDQDTVPTAVFQQFYDKNYRFGDHLCFGTGIATIGSAPNDYHIISNALGEAAGGKFKFVYSWTYEAKSSIQSFIKLGVNGLMVSADFEFGETTNAIPAALAIVNNTKGVRMATHNDQPFTSSSLSTAYEVIVTTGSFKAGGTNATLTFILTDVNGKTTQKAIKGDPDKMFEKGQVNKFAIPGNDLSNLASIEVVSDRQGSGSDWRLENIAIYDVATSQVYAVNPDKDVEATTGALLLKKEEKIYELVIRTSSTASGAGTDNSVKFVLNGKKGTKDTTLSATLDSSPSGVLESGKIDTFYLVGNDVGNYVNLLAIMIGGGLGSGWNLDSITVTDNLGQGYHKFDFDGANINDDNPGIALAK